MEPRSSHLRDSMFHLGLLCGTMDALGLLALANSSGDDHGSFIFPIFTYKNYFLTGSFTEADRFNVGVPIMTAALCYTTDNENNYLTDPLRIGSGNATFNIQSLPPLTNHGTSPTIEYTGLVSLHFTYDDSYIVMHALHSSSEQSVAIRCSFLAIINY